jgi:ribonuclease P/MRP protein subunit POP8
MAEPNSTSTIDVSISDAPNPTPTPSTKHKSNNHRGHEITSITIKTPPFSYAHLSLQTTTTSPVLDEPTINIYLTSALKQFLGLSGTAVASNVDILKVEGNECWVRVPRGDLSVFLAAVGGWIGGGGGEGNGVSWWVRGSGNWLSALGGKESVWND